MLCPICGKVVVPSNWNKRFDKYRCNRKFNYLKKVKDIRYLVSEDRILFNRLKNEGLL